MASFASINHSGVLNEDGLPRKKSYRSYKKKFLKMRHNFRERMRDSQILHDEEQRLLRLSRRLQQQNDQLVETLLDVSDSKKLAPFLSYNLDSAPPSPSDVPSLSPDQDTDDSETQKVQEAQAALEEVRQEHQAGQIEPEKYKEMEKSLTAIILHPYSLAHLSKINHSALHGPKAVPIDLLPNDIIEEPLLAYLDPTHEEEYIATLDSYLEVEPQGLEPIPPPVKPSEREKEREYQLNNPMSVYNWLTRHRHDIFIDQTEEQQQQQANAQSQPSSGTKDKGEHISSVKESSGVSKRTSSPKQPAQPTRSTKRERTSTSNANLRHQDFTAEEVLDDEGFVIGGAGVGLDGFDAGAGGGRKRKRGGKEDEAYRPKGGSSRPSKRKRASTGTGGGAAAARADRERREMEMDEGE